MYIARRPMQIDGEWRQIGEPVPEANEWLRVESYVNTGFIVWVEDPIEEVIIDTPIPVKKVAKKSK